MTKKELKELYPKQCPITGGDCTLTGCIFSTGARDPDPFTVNCAWVQEEETPAVKEFFNHIQHVLEQEED